ncbi:MAG: hypothetical protein WCR06_01930 [bacterium]
MNVRLFHLLVLAILSARIFFAKGEESLKYQFGKDELCFSSAPLTNGWRSIDSDGLRSVMGGKGKIETGRLPLREGVTLYRRQPNGLFVEIENKRCRISWQNIGAYLHEIRDADQMLCLLNVLHYDFEHTRIGLAGFSNIVHLARSHTNELPFVVTYGLVEEDTIHRGVFERDGLWAAHFLCREAASVVEYKYAVSNNSVARLRRVIVEGPDNPVSFGALEVLQRPAAKEARYQLFQRCYGYLRSQTINTNLASKADTKIKIKSKEASAGEPVNVPHEE